MRAKAASGGTSSSRAFAQRCFQKKPESRSRAVRTGAKLPRSDATGGGDIDDGPVMSSPPDGPAANRSAFQLSPGLLPLRVVHAVLLAVAAVGDRRLPELDRVEVLRRRAAVVLRCGAL